MTLLSASSELPVTIVLNVVNVAFWAVIAVGIVVRIAVVLRRRKRGELRERVGRPLMDSAAVESTAYGWKPAAQERLTTDAPSTTNTEP